MNDDCLKLTAYFEDRQRSGDGFLAEKLLNLYGAQAIATSFGPRKQLRSDEWLSLSENPPVAVAAVDTRAKIAELVDAVVAMTPRALLTLERARLITGDLEGFQLPSELHEAIKLTIYVGRQQRVGGVPALYAVCDLLHQQGVAGASVFLGVDGTARSVRHRARFFSRNVDVPVMIISVGDSDAIARAVPRLGAALGRPLLTLEPMQVCKRDGRLLSRPHALPNADAHGVPLFQKLMVYTSEDAHHNGVPVHWALVRRLRHTGTASGATVLRGIWGFHGDRKPHGDKFFQLGRQVPVTTIVVDAPERIAASFDIVDEVPAMVLLDGDERLGSTRLADYRY